MRREEAIRTAFLLSQGGEFAFVLLSLAKELKVLPDELNRLLIIVVVLSMALTPFLAELGKTVADASAAKRDLGDGAGARAPSGADRSSQSNMSPTATLALLDVNSVMHRALRPHRCGSDESGCRLYLCLWNADVATGQVSLCMLNEASLLRRRPDIGCNVSDAAHAVQLDRVGG